MYFCLICVIMVTCSAVSDSAKNWQWQQTLCTTSFHSSSDSFSCRKNSFIVWLPLIISTLHLFVDYMYKCNWVSFSLFCVESFLFLSVTVLLVMEKYEPWLPILTLRTCVKMKPWIHRPSYSLFRLMYIISVCVCVYNYVCILHPFLWSLFIKGRLPTFWKSRESVIRRDSCRTWRY